MQSGRHRRYAGTSGERRKHSARVQSHSARAWDERVVNFVSRDSSASARVPYACYRSTSKTNRGISRPFPRHSHLSQHLQLLSSHQTKKDPKTKKTTTRKERQVPQ